MRALAVLLVAVVCVAVTAAAVAAKPKRSKPPTPAAGLWKGERLDVGSALRFRVAKSRRRIGRISANVVESCGKDELETTTTLSSAGGWKVRRGRFGGRRKERFGRVTTVVTIGGQFTSPTRASGVVRQRTTIGNTTCDTGRLPWVATTRPRLKN